MTCIEAGCRNKQREDYERCTKHVVTHLEYVLRNAIETSAMAVEDEVVDDKRIARLKLAVDRLLAGDKGAHIFARKVLKEE